MQIIDLVNKCDTSPDQIWSKTQETHQFSGPVWTWSDDVWTHWKGRDVLNTYPAVFIIPTYTWEFIFDLLNTLGYI